MKQLFLILIALFISLVFALPPANLAQSLPPKLDGVKRKTELVELKTLDDSIKLDVRYATANNFVGRAVYAEPRAFLQKPAALALLRVHQKLKKQGYGTVIFDAYRPWSVTKLFWDATPVEKRSFVADPAKGSRHNRGCAVDVSLYDLKTGENVQMPSEYDEFTERAYPTYLGGTEEQRRTRDLLRKEMEAEGFTVNENEWWHFDYKNWRDYEIVNLPFSAVRDLDAALTKAKLHENKDLKNFFDQANVTGGFLLYDLQKNKFTAYDLERIDKGFVPASTSKVFNSLIFLETGALKDEKETFKWDGVQRSIPAWNQDHNLRSAFKVSAVWFYLEASKRVGHEQFQHYYTLANYGNHNTNGYGKDFWNKGDLRVTMREQINFLVRLHQNRLPFSARSIELVKDISVAEKTDKYILRAKTGWSDAYTPQVGWYIGYVTRGADAYFFATEIDIKTGADAPKRAEITRNILRTLKVIE